MNNTNFDIFISYKRKSLPTANNLYYRLTTRGYSTFFDLEEMGRDNFNVQLLNYIENAKDVFVILEESSLDGCQQENWEEKDWFCHEIAFALEKKKNIIPILLNGYKMPSEDFFPDKLKEFSFKHAPEFNFSFFEAYLDKLIEKEYLLSKPNIQDKVTSVFKFYSNESCQVYKEGKLVCSLEGMSDEPYYLPVSRKGDYRFKGVNSITSETKLIKEHIELAEEKDVDIQWEECGSLKLDQTSLEKNVESPQSAKDSVIISSAEKSSLIDDIYAEGFNDNPKIFWKNDINDISISIADSMTPLAVLLGPACVGKTMTLVRLVRYLVEQGYSVSPDRSFRSVDDNIYRDVCDSFQGLINSGYAARGTNLFDCMLVKIMKEGRCVIQVVDLAGELIMNYGLNTAPYYFNQILNSENPHIWIIMLEPYWRNPRQRREYVERIKCIQTLVSPKDRVIIVANKIDKTPFLEGRTRINSLGVLKQIINEYPGLMEIFSNKNPITSILRPYNCSFIPFVTGTYTIREAEPMLYVPSSSVFPKLLWKAMIK